MIQSLPGISRLTPLLRHIPTCVLEALEVLAIKWGLEYARLERLQRSTTEAMGQKRKADGSHKLSNADRLMRSP